jgi:D-alanyl-D-alanine carboxypeptidase
MRELIGEHIKEASLRRTAPVLAEQAAPRDEAQPTALTKTPLAARADPTPTATVTPRIAAGSNDPIQPLMVKTVSYRIAPMQTAALGPMPVLVPVAAPAPAPQPPVPQVSLPQPAAPQPEAPRTIVASAEPAPVAMTAAVKSDPIKPEVAKPEIAKPEIAKPESASAAPVKSEPAKPEPAKSEPPAQSHARGGWLIQIGAYDGESEAKQHLSAARNKVRDTLAAADPFTERVLKGDKALYRARFAGFDKATAEAACKQLKRNDFECMTVKN